VNPTPQWPGLGLVRSELEHLPRRRAFTDAHPGTEFDHVGHVYLGHVPYTEDGEERSITIRGDSWPVVLDALETYFEEDGPDTG
jgi:hypothetical protein